MDVQNTTSLLALVAAGVGITTLPRLAVPDEREDVAFIPTRYPDLQRILGIVISRERSLSPAAAAFVKVIEAAFRKPLR
jgi:DNA-binding transcriptional LysR family regulator